jgi:Leucine-rich repeat (LRR) protein
VDFETRRPGCDHVFVPIRGVLIAVLVMVTLVLVGCPYPFSSIERPELANPADPAARVPIRDVLTLIPDPALRQAVVATGARYNTDVRVIHTEDAGITDLTGILFLPVLEELVIHIRDLDTVITSIEPLRGHRTLRFLAISRDSPDPALPDPAFHSIGDYSPLGDLPALRGLDLSHMDVTAQDTAFFGFVPQLEELSLRGWDLSASGPPAMPNLRRLDISGSGITSLAALEYPLLEELRIEAGDLTGIGTAAGMPALRRLYAGDNSLLTEIAGIDAFSRLEELDLSWSQVSDLSPLSNLGNTLRYLRINDLPANAAFTLPEIASLEELEANGLVSDSTAVASLVGHPNLRRISLSTPGGATFVPPVIGNLFGTAVLPATLEEAWLRLEFDFSGNESLGALASWPLAGLEVRNPAGTSFFVTDLFLLSSPQLEGLALTGVNLSDGAGDLAVIASAFPNLRFLDIGDNAGVTDLAPLTSLSSLEEIRAPMPSIATAPPPTPYGVGSDLNVNGIRNLADLPFLRFLEITNSSAAYDYQVNGADVGIFELQSLVPGIEIRADWFGP